jgi:hypothetical protein
MTDAPIMLTRQEVADLTGRKLKSLQIKTLARMGIQHWVAADGHPRVPRAQFGYHEKPAPAPRRTEPNWAALG